MENRAEILCIGTEILLGNIVNTNAQVISQGLAELTGQIWHHSAEQLVAAVVDRGHEAFTSVWVWCFPIICRWG